MLTCIVLLTLYTHYTKNFILIITTFIIYSFYYPFSYIYNFYRQCFTGFRLNACGGQWAWPTYLFHLFFSLYENKANLIVRYLLPPSQTRPYPTSSLNSLILRISRYATHLWRNVEIGCNNRAFNQTPLRRVSLLSCPRQLFLLSLIFFFFVFTFFHF